MNLRNLFTASLAVGALGVTAVASAPTKDIVDTAVAAGSFKTLAKLVTQAGLVETLKSKGPFTVFAPTDEAFNKVPKAALNTIASNEDLLKKTLLAHVVAGKEVKASAALGLRGQKVETAGKEKIALAGTGQNLTVGGVKVVKTDIQASNGVIHVLEGVIVPPSVASALGGGEAQLSTKGGKAGCGGCKGN